MNFKLSIETDRFNAFLKEFVKKTDIDAGIVLKKFAYDLTAKIIQKTPVATGRARAGWFTALMKLGGAPIQTTGTVEEKKGMGEGRATMNLEGDEKYIEIVNGVPYAIYLEYGHSKKAPYGMVRISMRELSGKELPQEMAKKLRENWRKR